MPAEPAPGQAAPVPAAYARWYRADEPDATDEQIAGDWRIEPAAFREFWTATQAELARLREEAASLREQLRVIDADRKVLKGERDMAREDRDRLRIADADLRARLDDLASWWNREYASETGWPSRCAAELREALKGGSDA